MEPKLIVAGDKELEGLNWKAYRQREKILRKAVQFLPGPGEEQELHLDMGDGVSLVAKEGDYLVSPLEQPEYRWPVDERIFLESYVQVDDDTYYKDAITYLVPLEDLVDSDVDQLVTVRTLEGDETLRAGDFYLAKGVKEDIWPIPKVVSGILLHDGSLISAANDIGVDDHAEMSLIFKVLRHALRLRQISPTRRAELFERIYILERKAKVSKINYAERDFQELLAISEELGDPFKEQTVYDAEPGVAGAFARRYRRKGVTVFTVVYIFQ